MSSRDFRRLKVWEAAHRLALEAYTTTASFPRNEQYALTSQIRRSSASIPANIAEGCGRGGDRELSRFLRMAMGSASELEYHLLLARDLQILTTHEHTPLEQHVTEVKRMLASLIQKLSA
jgi:four helix bundle protein